MIKLSRLLPDVSRNKPAPTAAPPGAPRAQGYTGQSSFAGPTQRSPINRLLDGAPPSQPQGPMLPVAAPASTPEQQRVTESAQRVDEALRTGGTGAAAKALEDEARALGSPEQVDALLIAARPSVDAITADLAHRARGNHDDSGDGTARQTQQGVASLCAVADLASATGVDQLAGAIGSALKAGGGDLDLNQLDDRFKDVAESGGGVRLSSALALDLLNTQGLESAGNQILDASTMGVGKLREEFQGVQDEYAAMQQRLNSDLALHGNGMTEEERLAYQEAFWADPARQAVAERRDALGDRLAATMEQVSPALEALASQGDSEAAKKLLETYESLAQSDEHAQLALDFAGRLANDETLSSKIDEHTDGELETRLGDGIIAEAIPRVQADLMAAYADEGPDGVERAMAAFQGLMEPLKAGKTFKKLADQIKVLDETIDTFRTMSTFSENELLRAKNLLAKWDDSGKLGRALGVSALGFGIYKGVQHFGNGEWPEGLKDVLGAYRGGVHTAAGLVGMFSKSAELAGDVAKFGGKFLPAVGLALDGAQLADDIQNLKADGADAGEIISVLGTGIALVGDVVEFVPGVGTVVGGAVGILGAAVHALGGLISGFINGNKDREAIEADRARLLEEAGIPEDVRELLTLDPFDSASTATLGLSREQFLEHKRRLDEAWKSGDSNRISGYQLAGQAAAILGLEGQEALDFMQTLAGTDPQILQQLPFRLPTLYLGMENPTELFGVAQEALEQFFQYNLPPDVRVRLGIDFDAIRPEDANAAYFAAQPVLK